MEKYSEKIVEDYINGNDIEEYEIEKLENDRSFMTQVIDLTNDEKMYHFCSDDLKKDYVFVKYLILKFRDNTNFITEVADYFLENTDTDFERTELAIIMRNLTSNSKINKYQILCETIYSGKRLAVELAKLKEKDDNIANDIGMGFLFIYYSYNSSPIILDFYASMIIEDIFKEYDIDLESYLHSKFKKASQIDEQGLNNFMISFISSYDQMLGSYLCTHLNLLLPLKNKIIKIQNNWDRYIYTEEQARYSEMFKKVEDYIEQSDSIFTDTDLVYYIGSKLGILEKIREYDYVSDDIFDIILESISEDFVEETIRMNFKERIHYNNVKNIMTSILFGKKDDTFSEPSEDTVKTDRPKILKFDINSNKNLI